MPEADQRDDKQFFEHLPADGHGTYRKGASGYDWGMRNRLARIFRPESGRTVRFELVDARLLFGREGRFSVARASVIRATDADLR